MVRCDSLPSYEHLPENKWGIREPVLKGSDSFAFDQSDDKSGLDIVVMPGVAFTKSGKRLGYGKGYYDKFLDAAEQWSKARSKQSLSTSELKCRIMIFQVFTQGQSQSHLVNRSSTRTIFH